MKINISKLAVLWSIVASASAFAAWPEKPIRVIVPFSAGGPPDIVLRLLQDDVAAQLGQPIVIDNREGAAGNIGVSYAAQEPADGYTLLLASSGNFTVNQHLYRSFKIDPLKAFVPIVQLYEVPAVLVASTKVPATDFASFVAHAKQQKGSINFGSPGYGTTPHISLESLNRTLDMGMVGVTYRGAPPVLQALVGGDIQLSFAVAGGALQFIQTGKIRPLAVASNRRIALLPETPTLRELGWPNLANPTYWPLVAPTGTPDAILDRINAAMVKALSNRESRKKMEDMGITPGGSTRQEAADLLARESQFWLRVLKEQDVKPLD